MAKLGNLITPSTRTANSPIRSTGDRARTALGGPGVVRDAKSELYLLAVSNFVGEQTFHEAAFDRDLRFRELVRSVTLADPDWVAGLAGWLRSDANMRTAPVVLAVESLLARKEMPADARGTVPTRKLVDSVLQRADEPGEFIAYWAHRTGSRTLPGGVQRGLSDAVGRLYNERSALKYDGVGNTWRMGDVVELVHPEVAQIFSDRWSQAELYRYLLDRRHHADKIKADLTKLPLISGRRALEAIDPSERQGMVKHAEPGEVEALLKGAGATWEWLGGWVGKGGMDARAWENIIPTMGYMALLRNLRNFLEAGVSGSVLDQVASKMADPEEVAKSRQFPMRFLSAYKAVQNNSRFAWPLEQALDASLKNVPSLKGRTLVLVDMSGSMWTGMSDKSDLTRAEAASVFGLALAMRAEDATLVRFGTQSQEVGLPVGSSLLPLVRAFQEDMGGTNTVQAIQAHLKGHDRVVLLTDEQAGVGYGGYGNGYQTVDSVVPDTTWLHTFNLAGYRVGGHDSGSGRRSVTGGLTDQGFTSIPLLERGTSQDWPWVTAG